VTFPPRIRLSATAACRKTQNKQCRMQNTNYNNTCSSRTRSLDSLLTVSHVAIRLRSRIVCPVSVWVFVPKRINAHVRPIADVGNAFVSRSAVVFCFAPILRTGRTDGIVHVINPKLKWNTYAGPYLRFLRRGAITFCLSPKCETENKCLRLLNEKLLAIRFHRFSTPLHNVYN
jgi:hypothetical protein